MERADVYASISDELDQLKANGLFKSERIIISEQRAQIQVAPDLDVINLCANNYLGLADNKELVEAAKQALDGYGFGMASVRFICGTLDIHKKLERRLADFLGFEDAILYAACFDANGGLFESLLGPEDAIVSDELNHASIIDGIRLCKAKRYRYANNDPRSLESKLKEARQAGVRRLMIATDGVFSMDGIIANLSAVCDLADKYGALVMVDDCHATGFLGEHGKGSHEYCGVMGRIDIMTGTLGKALGGASGGYTVGRKEVVEWLRQRSRPYLFSNTLAPMIAAASLRALDLVETQGSQLRERLKENSLYFRAKMEEMGFDLVPGDHPIIPVMIGDAELANVCAQKLLEEGLYVVGFSYPVVPQGKARIRTQMSAGLTRQHLDKALASFEKVGKSLGLI